MKIIHGNSAESLKEFPDDYFDSVITDPPYGLSFMGKKWDYDVPEVDLWKEILRVLKPGSHALVACGTRTQHRMAVNLEDAGFEIRDIVAWIYGSGFPKSLNIAKAIQKQEGVELEDTGIISPISRPNVESDLYKSGKVGKNFTYKNITTESAKQWDGWGTALKPAMELWTLCRKPISEDTIAENVLKWGTGGINIDESRVEITKGVDDSQLRTMNRRAKTAEDGWGMNSNASDTPQVVSPTGRFPANLIHDGSDEVVSEFPQSKGQCGDLVGHGKEIQSPNGIYGKFPPRHDALKRNDTGSAARFFYCAKASKKERGEGNSHPTVKPIALMEYLVKLITPPKGIVLDPFMGSGSTVVAAVNLSFDFVGIEKEQEYVAIAEKRIEAVVKNFIQC